MDRENALFTDAIHNGHDYTQPGFYGLTLCTYHRRWFFGMIQDGQMQLNRAGHIAQEAWVGLANRWPCVTLHEFVFMPNHMHALIELIETPGQKRTSLFEVVRTFKGRSSRMIRKSVDDLWVGWEKNQWSSVILDEKHLAHIRQYILNNPAKWAQDRLMREDYKRHEIRRSRLHK